MSKNNFQNCNLRFVDFEALSEILRGSHEDVIEKIAHAFESVNDLFKNEEESSKVRVVGTFSDRVIVVNEEGRFFEAKYTLTEDEDNDVEIGVIEEIEVPVKSFCDLGVEARKKINLATKAYLENDIDKAEQYKEDVRELMDLGVKITPESLESAIIEFMKADYDWLEAVNENRNALERFIGSYSKSKIEALNDALEVSHKDLFESFHNIKEFINNILKEIARTRVDSSVVIESEKENSIEIIEQFNMFSCDFSDFVGQTLALVENVLSFEDEGSKFTKDQIIELINAHNKIVKQLNNVEMAAAFCEQFARSVQS